METKPFWQSVTFWGAITTFLAMLANTFGVDLPFTADELSSSILTVIAAVTTGLTIWGRFRAKTDLTP